MGIKLAIDFGTTNSLLARWDSARQAGQVVAIPNLSNNFGAEPGLIPSPPYVRDGWHFHPLAMSLSDESFLLS